MAYMRPSLPFLALVFLAGCSNPVYWFTPYRMEIQQGNYVTQDMVSQLKAGMTRDQVRFVLGTPLINDVFHQDRWDYIFVRKRNRESPLEERRLTLFFGPDGRLDRLEGDVTPGPGDEAAILERK